MIRRYLPYALAGLGLIAIVVGIVLGTVFKASDRVTATLPGAPQAPVVVVDPGVLPLVDDAADISVTAAEGEPIFAALASPADIEAWVQDGAVQHITGLKDWSTLALSEVTGDGEAANPTTAELFKDVRTGEGNLQWSVNDKDHSYALMVATDGTKPAPQVSLSWHKEPQQSLMWPLVSVGTFTFLLGALLFFIFSGKRPRPAGPSAETEVIYVPALTREEAEGLTRREIREREREREREAAEQARAEGKRDFTVMTSATIPVITEPILEQNPQRLVETGMAGGAMIIPAAPRAEQWRAGEFDDDALADAHEGGDRVGEGNDTAVQDDTRFAPQAQTHQSNDSDDEADLPGDGNTEVAAQTDAELLDNEAEADTESAVNAEADTDVEADTDAVTDADAAPDTDAATQMEEPTDTTPATEAETWLSHWAFPAGGHKEEDK